MLTKLFDRLSFVLILYCLGIIAVASWPLSAVILILVAIYRVRSRRKRQLSDLGSARFADESDLIQAGMLGASTGIILGRPLGNRSRFRFGKRDSLVRLPNTCHTAIFAPTGAGKSTSIAIPMLKTNPDPSVILDYKGELYHKTADHRRKYFNHQIAALDVYKIATSNPDRFNPLERIPADDPNSIDTCRELAKCMVSKSGFEPDPHWTASAEICIAAITSLVVAHGEAGSRTLEAVHEIISSNSHLDKAISALHQSPRWSGFLAKSGHHLERFRGNEKDSVLSSTLRHLHFLGTPAIIESTSSSTFDPSKLRTGGLTVYLIIPPERAEDKTGLLRLWIWALMRECMKGGLQ